MLTLTAKLRWHPQEAGSPAVSSGGVAPCLAHVHLHRRQPVRLRPRAAAAGAAISGHTRGGSAGAPERPADPRAAGAALLGAGPPAPVRSRRGVTLGRRRGSPDARGGPLLREGAGGDGEGRHVRGLGSGRGVSHRRACEDLLQVGGQDEDPLAQRKEEDDRSEV